MIEFTDDCLIGIKQLDDEHRHLFDLLNKGINLIEDHNDGDSYDAIRAFLSELTNYADTHFEHEEAYMREINDPELPSQQIQHNLFRNRINNWYIKNIDSSQEQLALLTELMQYMFKWLYSHILGSDILIGKLSPVDDGPVQENPCEFSDEYLTGIELIDAEHRELFKLIAQINELIKIEINEYDFDEIKDIVGRLNNYVKEHFSDEEKYMESINYDGLDAQKTAHAVFIDKMNSINFEDIRKHPQENMEKLVEFLTKWLIQHILRMDKKIGTTLQ